MAIDNLTHKEVETWLERALKGREPLPFLAPDEYPHLGILRLEKTLSISFAPAHREKGNT
jgi:hypothetical protein